MYSDVDVVLLLIKLNYSNLSYLYYILYNIERFNKFISCCYANMLHLRKKFLSFYR